MPDMAALIRENPTLPDVVIFNDIHSRQEQAFRRIGLIDMFDPEFYLIEATHQGSHHGINDWGRIEVDEEYAIKKGVEVVGCDPNYDNVRKVAIQMEIQRPDCLSTPEKLGLARIYTTVRSLSPMREAGMLDTILMYESRRTRETPVLVRVGSEHANVLGPVIREYGLFSIQVAHA